MPTTTGAFDGARAAAYALAYLLYCFFPFDLLLSRQEGVRQAIKAMKAGRPFYYLPDMDYGQRDTIFVPFFGVPAATITGRTSALIPPPNT